MNGLALGVALVAYNNAMNLWGRFHGRLYVPANLALAAGSAGTAMWAWNLDSRSLGLASGQSTGFMLGVCLGIVAASPLFLALLGHKPAVVVADARVAGMSSKQLLSRTLLRVPVGTALAEEVLFRGVLYAVLASEGPAGAAAWSSLAFGLWHIAPTYNLLKKNGALAGRSMAATAVLLASGVLLTAAAGLVLIWLRVETGGIAAPFGLHATVNSLGTVAAHLANKRTGQP